MMPAQDDDDMSGEYLRRWQFRRQMAADDLLRQHLQPPSPAAEPQPPADLPALRTLRQEAEQVAAAAPPPQPPPMPVEITRQVERDAAGNITRIVERRSHPTADEVKR
jgi:hypothetical protein